MPCLVEPKVSSTRTTLRKYFSLLLIGSQFNGFNTNCRGQSKSAPYHYKKGSGLSQPTSRADTAAIPASTESKAKLSAFSFGKLTPRRGKGPRDTKESISGGEGDVDLEAATTLKLAPGLTKECPQTPAPRLPLCDLIGIGEEGKHPQPIAQLDCSPEDRITWQLSPKGSQVTPVAAKGKASKRKRPMDSSPMGSPGADTPRGNKKPGAFNLQPLGNTLKTPLADPAMQLWSKYSNKPSGPLRPINPATRLFNGDASKNRDTNTSPLGLRRAYSCGPDWPVEPRLKKKRKTIPVDSRINPDNVETPSAKEPNSGSSGLGSSRLSRVNRLVDKVKETLGKPSLMPRPPSSSSPLPERPDHDLDLTSSPLGKGRGQGRGVARPTSGGAVSPNGAAPAGGSDSEDFGDFDDGDIDIDMLEEAERFAENSQSQTMAGGVADTVIDLPSVPAADPIPWPVREEPKASSCNEDDEFDDGDDAFYTENFEEMVAKYDTPGVSSAPTEIPTETPLKELQSDAGSAPRDPIADANAQFLDEFGEIDFSEWEEEELRITQGLVRIAFD